MKKAVKNGKQRSSHSSQGALRALRRAAKKVHAENRKHGLPVIIWRSGKVVAISG
jgi:hypothetical protein